MQNIVNRFIDDIEKGKTDSRSAADELEQLDFNPDEIETMLNHIMHAIR